MFYAQSAITVIAVTFVYVYSLVYTNSLCFSNQPDSKSTEELLWVHFLLLFYKRTHYAYLLGSRFYRNLSTKGHVDGAFYSLCL